MTNVSINCHSGFSRFYIIYCEFFMCVLDMVVLLWHLPLMFLHLCVLRRCVGIVGCILFDNWRTRICSEGIAMDWNWKSMRPHRLQKGISHRTFSPTLQRGTMKISQVGEFILYRYLSEEISSVCGPVSSGVTHSDPHHCDKNDAILLCDSNRMIFLHGIHFFCFLACVHDPTLSSIILRGVFMGGVGYIRSWGSSQ